VHRNGRTEEVRSLDRAWLDPASGVLLWVDLAAPSIPEQLLLSDTFAFHPLAVEDARSDLQYPKIEPYDGFLYVVLHGLALLKKKPRFATHDIDFFLGRHFLVTVHDGSSRSIEELRAQCTRNHAVVGEGPVALFHRIVDRMVDRYFPEIDRFQEELDKTEDAVFENPEPRLVRRILKDKRDVATLRRIVTPQRDAIGRLARREYSNISAEMALHFRDVYDQLMRVSDETLMLQDRLTGMLEAHMSNLSNRVNQVVKVLTVLTTIFMPLTVLTGLYGMNVPLPPFPGGDDAQFWWLFGSMLVIIAAMLVMFRRKHWI
jgi:magnesium transporter